MKRPRTAILAACLAAALAAPAYARLRPPATLPELIAELDAEPEVMFVFHPGDCKLGADAIAAMNRVAARPGTRLHGVMLAPPVDPRAADGLVRAFGIRFPVTFDRDGEWRTAVDEARIDFPAVLVSRAGRLVPVGDPHDPEPLYALVANTLNGEV
jgi:hypothetical protein